MSNAIRAIITTLQVTFFFASLIVVLPLAVLRFLFPNQHKKFKIWKEQRRLTRSQKTWFASGGGYGGRYRYFADGDWVEVFTLDPGLPCPDLNVGSYVWQISRRPLCKEEVELLETRMSRWFHHESTRLFRYEPPTLSRRASDKERKEWAKLKSKRR